MSVYFIEAVGTNRVKIGYAKDPLQAGNGGTSESRIFLFRFEDWEHIAQRQRRTRY